MPRGLLEIPDPALVLKIYEMHKGDGISPAVLEEAKMFLRTETESGALAPQLGIGFAIVSEDMVNAGRWGVAIDGVMYPYVLMNALYQYPEGGPFAGAKPLDISDVGAFCAFELAIVAHESEEWRKYLMMADAGTEAVIEDAKRRYLQSFYEGGV